MDTKTCENCGRDYPRPSWSSGIKWERQRYCSVVCANRGKPSPVQDQTKTCQECGREFRRGPNYPAKLWATRRYCSQLCWGKVKSRQAKTGRETETCPICGDEFYRRYATQRTCRARACSKAYRETIGAAAQGERMKADYASGKRKRLEGISPRETALWPLLVDHGWCWRMRWTDAWGTFELDFAQPEGKLIVEIDGVEHREPRGRRKDEARDAELEVRGWRILRIPNEDVDASPEAVAARVAEWAADPMLVG